MKRIVYFSTIILSTILLLELALRILGFYYTYTEKMDGQYVSYYDRVMPTWYWGRAAYDSIIDTKPEYTYRSKANNYSYRDKDFDSTSSEGKVRILTLGDSFAQGLGAPEDSAWPQLFQDVLNQRDSGRYRVYNCGMVGSDPFFEYVQLRDKLLPLKPDLVIMSINYSDINDYITRGGMERFKKDGTTVFAHGPWFEPIYKRSHLVRCFVHFVLRYDFSLLSPAAHRTKVSEAIDQLTDCAATMQRLCDDHHIRLLVVIHPYIDPYDRYLKNQDQLPAIVSKLRKDNIAVVSLFDDFGKTVTAANYKTYSWPRDMHYTAKGYDLFAHFLATEIYQNYPEILYRDTAQSH